MEVAMLFADEGEESRMAEELLKQQGLKYKRIDVSGSGLLGWLLFEYGTARVPLLVIGATVLVGLEEIRRFLAGR